MCWRQSQQEKQERYLMGDGGTDRRVMYGKASASVVFASALGYSTRWRRTLNLTARCRGSWLVTAAVGTGHVSPSWSPVDLPSHPCCILSSSQCCKKLVFIFCSFNNTSQQLQIMHTDRIKNIPSYYDFCLFFFPFMNALCFSPPSAKFVTHYHTNGNIWQHC